MLVRDPIDPGRPRPVGGRSSCMRWLARAGKAALVLPCALLAAWSGLLSASVAAQPQAQPESRAPWRVVLIRSWDSLYPINVVRESALREAMLDRASRVIEFFPEEIDLLRFPSAIEPELASLL